MIGISHLPTGAPRLLAVALFLCVLGGFFYPAWQGFDPMTTSLNYAARLLVVVAIAVAIAVSTSGRVQIFWGYLMVSTLLDVAAATVWMYYLPEAGLSSGVDTATSTPIVAPFADLLQLGSYLVLVSALWWLREGPSEPRDWRITSLDMATSVFALSAVIWVWVVSGSASGNAGRTWAILALELGYPVLDLAMLGSLILFRARPSQEVPPALVRGISWTVALYFLVDALIGVGFYLADDLAGALLQGSGAVLGLALAVLGYTALLKPAPGGHPLPDPDRIQASVSWVGVFGVVALSATALASVALGGPREGVGHQFDFIVIGSMAVAGLMLLVRQVISSRSMQMILESRVANRTVELALARDQLSAANRSLGSLLDNAPLAIAVRDAEGEFVFGNRVWQQLAEQTSALNQLVPAALAQEAVDELQVETVDGESKRLLALSADYLNERGEADGNWIILTDITQLRQREQQMQTMTRLASLGEMATGLAHEMNQPLQGLRLTLANIARQLPADEDSSHPLQPKLDRMSELINRASALVARMKSYGRAPDDEREPFDLVQSVRTVAGLLGEQLHLQQVQLSMELPAFAAWGFGHPMEFEQVLINVINNAADAILEQGNRGQIRVQLTDGTDAWQMTITDNGPGFPPAVMERLMEPFFTTKPVGKG
ncbi:MAG: ATP-binding protein, partial [Cellvibrionales bacterium]